MSLPTFLVTELRQVFRTCARSHTSCRPRSFTNTPWCSQRTPTPTSGELKTNEDASRVIGHSHKKSSESKIIAKGHAQAKAPSPSQSTDIVPRSQDGKALDGERTTQVPMRIVPKAQITPNLRLKPLERLHVEQLTRRTPVIAPIKGTRPMPCSISTNL